VCCGNIDTYTATVDMFTHPSSICHKWLITIGEFRVCPNVTLADLPVAALLTVIFLTVNLEIDKQ
jgi:hypothetical protein